MSSLNEPIKIYKKKEPFTFREKISIGIIGLISILVLTTLGVSFSSTYSRISKANNDRNMANEMFSIIFEELGDASRVQIAGEKVKPLYTDNLEVIKGKLCINDRDVYEKLTLSKRKVSLSVNADTFNINVTINILDEDNIVVYTSAKTVRARSLDMFNREIEGIKNKKVINPVISYESSLS